ncbi:MAG: hypothetical protein ABIO61_09110, partial [Thermomonas sp.]
MSSRNRSTLRPAIAPITHAIRKALVASAAMMALSLPGTVLAASDCQPGAAQSQHCESTLVQGTSLMVPLDDPSQVVDGALPSSVNAGFATLAATAFETGIVVTDPYAAELVNADDIVVSAYATGDAQAYGAVAGSDHFSYLTNTVDGSIEVVAGSDDGNAQAVGAYAYAGDSASLWNYGAISAVANSAAGDAQAYAAFANGTASGIGLLINGGELDAHASVGDGGEARSTGAYASGTVATIFNDGSIDVSASAGDGGSAVARGARSYGMYAAVSNDGDVVVDATVVSGSANATGIDAFGIYGASAYNAGDIHAAASAGNGTAYAIGSSAIGNTFGAYTTNTGTIQAEANADSARAVGALNVAAYVGNAITTNEGSIAASATGDLAQYGEFEAIAFGVYNFAFVYDSLIYNNGSIQAHATALADISGTYGFLTAKAIGADAISLYGYGDVMIANAGDITAVAMTSQGYASAWGAVAQTAGLYGGTAVIDNEGTISAHAYSDIGVATAIGAYAINQVGDITAVNHGDISASARAERGIVDVSVDYAYATGLKVTSYYGTVGIDNYGSISAIASAEGAITGARGIQASGAQVSITNAAGASISAIGEVDLFGGGFATGIEASGVYAIDIINDGDIDVYGHAHAFSEGDHGFYGAARATGIYAAAGFQGNVSVVNNGDISATAIAEDSVSWAQGGAGATGINAYAKYDATIVNNGDIAASAQAEFGIVGAYGVIGHGNYSTSVVNAAGASILAEASTGSLAGDNYGGRAVSFGTHVFGNGMDHGVVYNAGSIAAHATATAQSANPSPTIASSWGADVGAYSNVVSGTIINLGDIASTASADFGYATAYGSYVLAATSAATSNAGTIFASADATEGNAWAVGAFGSAVEQRYYVPCEIVDGPYGPYSLCDYANAYSIVTGGDGKLENTGVIASVARATGGVGRSYGAVAIGGFSASIANAGQISALAEADDALAVGALVNAFYGPVMVENSGVISAVARGDIADAKGVHAIGLSGTQVDNTGMILASAYGDDATAIAVEMDSTGDNVLTNSGTIAAFGDGARIAIDASVGGSAWLSNSGTLIGAIQTGDGDDTLDNAAGGTWLMLGSSDFGAGDDHITNHGLFAMVGASLALGGYVDGNGFDNFGTLAISGAGNLIDMGGAFAANNNGTITFIDGAANDVLAISGDFGGSGTLNFDADFGHQLGDQLQVTGNIDASTMQTINANVFGVPTQAQVSIPLVTASGSLGGHFTLGNVQSAGVDFLSLAFGLSQSAHAVSLELGVTGLDDAGTLASSITSGASNLLNSQVGTFRQRLGVNPYGDAGKVMSAFVRMYTDEGDVTPQHAAANFGQGGNFDYNQSSWGRELGINANLTTNLHAGLVLGTADSRQRLIHGGGENRMDGMTWGAYATWYVPHGFYVDLSGRWMAADVRSMSAAGVR